MKDKGSIGLVVILIGLLLLGGCSFSKADSSLDGAWKVDSTFSSSEVLNGNLFFDSKTVFFVDPSKNIEKTFDYKMAMPGAFVLYLNNEKVRCQYKIDGDLLAIQFSNGTNVYRRISLEDLYQVEDSNPLFDWTSELTPAETLSVFDPNAGISEATPSDSSAPETPAPPEVPTATEIPPTLTPTTAVSPTAKTYYPLSDCGPSKLHVGDSAYLPYGEGKMTIRKEPSARISGTELAIRKMDEGEILHVIDGPVCDMGWVFWEVRTVYSEYGWIPEGDGSAFWVLPLNTQSVCSGAKPTRLWVGARAFVEPKPNDYNRVYPRPVIDYDNMVDRMKPGSSMQVLAGPECGPNHEGVWWYVRSEDSGKEGWTRESDYSKDYYFIAPYIPRR